MRPTAKKRGVRKNRMAECVVARESDLGVNDTQFTCSTHLGGILKEGDTVLGYDLVTAPWVEDEEITKHLRKPLPDIILVRKCYPTKGERRWQLKNFEADEKANAGNQRDMNLEEAEYEEFMQEVEADREMRANINVYKSSKARTKAAQKAANKVATESQKPAKSGKAAPAAFADSDGEEEDEESEGDSDDDNRLAGDDDDDEEAIRLDELLDDLVLSHEEDQQTAQILTAAEAAAMPQLLVPTTGFDPADFDPKDLKFK